MTGLLKCFGTGPGKSNGERAYSAYLYQFGDIGIMVDCGEPLSLSFKKANSDPNGFDALLISHTHPDHIGGFLSFIQSLKQAERKRPLAIHLPAHATPALKQLLEAAYVFPKRLPFHLSWHPLQSEKRFSAGNVQVIPYPTSHLAPLSRKAPKRSGVSLEAFSFVFHHDDGAVAHSGDIGSERDLAPLLQAPLKLLVVELAHATPNKLFPLLAKSSVARVACVHLKDSQWEKRAELKKEADSVLGRGKAFFPKDGAEISF
jgi:Cft2 family RNA processing exonuclease